MVLKVPDFGSNTRFFWIFALNVRRVARNEWLRLLPVEPFLPVISHIRDIKAGRMYRESGKSSSEQMANYLMNRGRSKNLEVRRKGYVIVISVYKYLLLTSRFLLLLNFFCNLFLLVIV